MFDLLIVDDKKTVRDGLKRYVNWSEMGFNVAGDFSSAQEAIKFIETDCADVLVTDIVMPDINGLELVKEVRLINPRIKVVIISAYGKFEYAQEAIRLGAFSYLTKPVDFEKLKKEFAAIKRILEEESFERLQKKEYNDIARSRYLNECFSLMDGNKDPSSGLIVENARKYIDAHYNEEISLNKLSEIVYVNPVYLSRLFKEKIGENFIDYLTNVRIDRAKKLLEDLSLRIYDITQMVGYESRKHFWKTFKDITGMSPKEYRNKLS